MKKIINSFVVLLFSLLSLVSCEKVTVENNPGFGEKVKVNISISDFNYSIGEGNIRASGLTPFEAGINRIALSVFNEMGDMVYSATKSDSDDDFDQITCSLYPGDYSFVVVAHKANNGEVAAEIESAQSAKVTISKFSKIFSVKQSVQIEAEKTNEVVIDLGKRVSSQFQLMISDDQPDEVASCEIIVNPSAVVTNEYSFNPTTGLALANYQYKLIFSISKSTVGSIKGKTLGANCLVTGDSQVVDVEVNMKDASGNVVKSRTFTNVTLKPRMATRATGTFFNSSTKLSLAFDDNIDISSIINF